MKTIVTIWYYILSFDGKERIEGPTPELIEVQHSVKSTPWDIKSLAYGLFTIEHGMAEVHDIDLGDTTGV